MNTNQFKLLTSPAFWLLLVTFFVAGGNAVLPLLPPQAAGFVSAILAVLTIFAHKNEVNKAVGRAVGRY